MDTTVQSLQQTEFVSANFKERMMYDVNYNDQLDTFTAVPFVCLPLIFECPRGYDIIGKIRDTLSCKTSKYLWKKN